MSIKKLVLVLSLFATSIALVAAEREDSDVPGTENESALMRAKLSSSQKVVEGLMSKDFDLIRKGGEELAKICSATQWQAENDQVYAHYRAELRRTAKKLAQLGEEKNLDGAAYTYMHSLTTCISCHSYCRDVLHVAAGTPHLKAAPIPTTEDGANSRQQSKVRR